MNMMQTKTIVCAILRLKQIRVYGLSYGAQRVLFGRLPMTFSRGNRACFCAFCSKVEMFFSSWLILRSVMFPKNGLQK